MGEEVGDLINSYFEGKKLELLITDSEKISMYARITTVSEIYIMLF